MPIKMPDILDLRPGDAERLDRIGNALWKQWHAHLYACRQCGTGTKCASGHELYTKAEQHPSAIDR